MASEYRLVSYDDGGTPKAGVLVGERVVPVAALLPGLDGSSVLGILRAWDRRFSRNRPSNCGDSRARDSRF